MTKQQKQELEMLRDHARDTGIDLPEPPTTTDAAIWDVYIDECRWAFQNGGDK